MPHRRRQPVQVAPQHSSAATTASPAESAELIQAIVQALGTRGKLRREQCLVGTGLQFAELLGATVLQQESKNFIKNAAYSSSSSSSISQLQSLRCSERRQHNVLPKPAGVDVTQGLALANQKQLKGSTSGPLAPTGDSS